MACAVDRGDAATPGEGGDAGGADGVEDDEYFGGFVDQDHGG
jgi:hypothetical protein